MTNVKLIGLAHIRNFEYKLDKNGKPFARGTVYFDNGQTKEYKKWVFLDFALFGNPAEWLANNNPQDGDSVIIDGYLSTDEWEKDGQKRSKTVFEPSRFGTGISFVKHKEDGDRTDVKTVTDDNIPF